MRFLYDYMCIGFVLLTAWRRVIFWLFLIATVVLVFRLMAEISEPSVGCSSTVECAEVERG